MYQKLVGKIDNADLIQLFEQEKGEISTFWQDRQPSLENLYHSFESGTQIEFGIAQQELLGTGRFVPMRVRWPKELIAHLVTDFYVRPSARKGLIAGRLFHLMLKTGVELRKDSIYFGIENAPGFMDAAKDMASGYDVEFSFIGVTRLSQLFLTTRFDKSKGSGEKILLKNCSDVFWRDFLNHYESFCEGFNLSPIFEASIRENILKIDPNAEIYFYENDKILNSGFILLDMNSVRRFRWNSERSLVRMKLDRYRKSKGLLEIKDNDCFMNKILALAWGTGGKDETLNSLFLKAVGEADQLGYDAILFRDLELNLHDLRDLDILNFDRRVFVFNNSPEDDILAHIAGGNLKFKLEMLTL